MLGSSVQRVVNVRVERRVIWLEIEEARARWLWFGEKVRERGPSGSSSSWASVAISDSVVCCGGGAG